MEWVFQERRRGETHSANVTGEFFRSGGIVYSLVRESIQNSLDARKSDENPVEVSFILRKAKSGKSLFESLTGQEKQKHFRSSGLEIDEGDKSVWLIVEDRNTSGLKGDPAVDEEDDPENDFYYFWRNEGISKKREGMLGSWGLGKTVYPASSQCHIVFGHSLRNDNPLSVFMGRSLLPLRTVGGKEYKPDSFYGVRESDESLLVLPEEDQWCQPLKDLGITREKGDIGLSVMIPAPVPELKGVDIMRQVEDQFFHPIVCGSLVVYVEDEVRGDVSRTRIDRAWMLEKAAQGDDVAFAHKVDLSRRLHAGEFHEVRLPLIERRKPDWSGRLDKVDREDVLDRIESGEVVKLIVELTLKFRNTGMMTVSELWFVLAKSDSMGVDCLRGGLPLPNAVSGKIQSCYCQLHPQGRLAAMLRDAENPSHKSWEAGKDLTGKYIWAKETVQFVKSTANKVGNWLYEKPVRRHDSLLKDLFPFETDCHSGSGAGQGKGQGKGKGESRTGNAPHGPIDIEVVQPDDFDVSKIRGGFRIAKAPGSDRSTPKLIKVTANYAVLEGRPIYDALDFSFKSNIVCCAQRAEIKVESGNVLFIKPVDGSYEVDVTGFHPYKDLTVDAREARDNEENI